MDSSVENQTLLSLDQIPQLETPDKSGIYVFRYDNPSVPNTHPNSPTSKDEFVGKWFTNSLKSLRTHISTRPPGGNIVITSVPKDQLEKLRASNLPISQEMETEPDDFIITDEFLADSQTIPFTPTASAKRFTLEDLKKIDEFLFSLADKLEKPNSQEPLNPAA